MNRPLLNKAFAVGLLVAVCGVAFLVAFTFFRKGGYSDKDTYRVHTFYEDATGLTWKSRVQIAGIQVGEVERIALQQGRARLDLRIRKDIDVRADACLTKRFPSTLLPDALLDLAPGSLRAQSLRDLPEEQREITCALEATSVAKLLDSMAKISTDVQSVTRELSQMVSGSQGSIRQIIANLEKASSAINRSLEEGQDKIAAILDNTQSFTGTLADVAQADKQRYRDIAKNLDTASQRLDGILASVQQMVGSGDESGDLRKTMAEARESLQHLNGTLKQVEKVANNIGEGKGVAGKLLNDERLGEKFSGAVETVSDYVDKLGKLQIKVDLRSEWLLTQRGSKTYAGFALVPRPDKYYLFQVVSDPRGVNTQTVETVVSQTPAGQASTTTTRTLNQQTVSFSLEFAKRFGPAGFRIGIIESSGGAGADLYLLDDRLKLSLDVYQFSRPDRPTFPRAKIWADYTFFRYLYVTMGSDDFLNAWRAGRWPGGPKFAIGQDVFFGGGITFTDDDLKTLLGVGGGAAASGAASSTK
jgi:phospholipid/cholesterol/gamma-HCH transport system substrate-binding protein